MATMSVPSRVGFTDLFGTEAYAVIHDELESYLDLEDILSLSRVCKALVCFRTRRFKKMSNINERLKRFVRDPIKFRSLLSQCDGIIMGTFILETFEMAHQYCRTLNVVLDVWARDFEFMRNLRQEGYKQRWATGDSEEWVGPNDFSINIVRPEDTPVQGLLDNAQTTAAFCFATWDKMYCIYAGQTLFKKEMFFLRNPREFLSCDWVGYTRRGWENKHISWPDFLSPAELERMKRPRMFGDKHSLVIPLQIEGVAPPSFGYFDAEYCQFSLGYDEILVEFDADMHFTIQYDVLE